MAPNCLYTVATDVAGQHQFTLMAKILVASQLRNFCSGDIFIVHNAETPLFRVERKGLTEVTLPPTTSDGKRLKYKARQWIDAERYDWVCFLDCNMLAQRNMDHLLDTHILSDILWQPEGKMTGNAYNSYFHDHGAFERARFTMRHQHLRQVAVTFTFWGVKTDRVKQIWFRWLLVGRGVIRGKGLRLSRGDWLGWIGGHRNNFSILKICLEI